MSRPGATPSWWPIRLPGVALLALLAGATPARAQGPLAARARRAIVGLELDTARRLLDVPLEDPAIGLERGRLALYAGDCDGAVALLQRPDLEDTEAGAELLGVALGCQRATAATVVVRDEQRHVVVRLQHDGDAPLVPLLADTAVRVRETLGRDLGIELALPIHIDLVRDQLALSALTGLPEKAAQTTGTVGVAKWGRVVLLSPRATRNGYPWLDTLAHELTHLAMSQATLDRAPLWLQEGVAKREEVRWREPEPLDSLVSPDSFAAAGIARGLGRPLTGLGPSLAMLPSPDEASVAYAQVTSFIRFWADENGDDGLAKLLRAIRDAPAEADVDAVLTELTGQSLAAWEARWRQHLAAAPGGLPADLAPGEPFGDAPAASRRLRLGRLLLERGHAAAASAELVQAFGKVPFAPAVRCAYADALLTQGARAEAAELVTRPLDVHARSGRWWSLHALLAPSHEPLASWRALSLDPLDPAVACEERPAGQWPEDELRRAICEAARRIPTPP